MFLSSVYRALLLCCCFVFKAHSSSCTVYQPVFQKPHHLPYSPTQLQVPPINLLPVCVHASAHIVGGYIVLGKFGYLLHHSVTLLAKVYEKFSIHTLSESKAVRLSWLCSVVHVQLKCISVYFSWKQQSTPCINPPTNTAAFRWYAN